MTPALLAALHTACFPPAETWDAPAFATLLAQPGVAVRLDPAGGFVLWRVAADEAEILTIAVHPEARRQGIGRRLLAMAGESAAQAGAARLFLEVSRRNTAAVALYAASGFQPVGSRRRYYPDGSDAIVMQRSLILGAAAGA